ncbi:MAG: GAF domain-containing protein, partial [Robiginitomaculum sp.]|nr:GAF domain-containing protein [Robiginitomaculum sp.]
MIKIPGPISIKSDPGVVLLKRIRALMASEAGVQTRLDKFAKIIAASMKVNVASIYLRAGDDLELCATKGLKQSAVHTTRLSINEGLVGYVARRAKLLNLAEASDHPDFAFKEETGEQRFHSFLGVPLLRGGRNLGVLVVQGKRARVYSEAEVEHLLTAATLLAEIAVEDERSGGAEARLKGIRLTPTGAETIVGQAFADGLAQGRAVLHLPPISVGKMLSSDTGEEQARLSKAIRKMRRSVDAMVDGEMGGQRGEMSAASKEIFESYRMFAYDRQWLSRLHEAVHSGLTAEAAVERVRNEHHARMLTARAPYLR